MKRDHQTTIEELRNLVVDFRDKREWKQFHNPKDLAIAISLEVAELLEQFRWRSTREVESMFKDEKKKQKIAEELAHIVWQCLNFSDVGNIDISTSLIRALEHAKKKYPVEKFRGKLEKYDEA